ncbi:GNAT family N-acetyltransferase [Denitrobaculum tricleocarpae]|uniref:N-acetyltransferase n=1 Tax=Denitrobaculum tricleocarpae TaxID=2591009 RepID=A0A545TKK9_9PROT|nr:N-acetyltransferase [Denitrobaculum tricleocarpae]TQV77701.1 N-acetyltransferase [Denitrobaculum tricleocarpae]
MKHEDIDAIAKVHRLAFGPDEGDEIAQLAKDLFDLPGTISISAMRDGQVAGNVMFTPFAFAEHPDINCYMLSPCGVLPEYQGQGVGKEIMEASTEHLRSIGVDAVLVLGVPTFYPRYGYVPTDKQTPYPDLQAPTDAWMVLELTPGTLAKLSGPTKAAPPFMREDWWDILNYGQK